MYARRKQQAGPAVIARSESTPATLRVARDLLLLGSLLALLLRIGAGAG